LLRGLPHSFWQQAGGDVPQTPKRELHSLRAPFTIGAIVPEQPIAIPTVEERAMSPFFWFRPLLRRRSVHRQTRVHPVLEALEDRLAPATFMVKNTNESWPGSLRQAILSANATAAADTITFNIPGGGFHFIEPLSPLPKITAPVGHQGRD
jgi:hypothetical protein